ncbi:MAG: hypothetical protein ACLSA2_10205 [Candidatus Gastranaerophilaceae bacterium]
MLLKMQTKRILSLLLTAPVVPKPAAPAKPAAAPIPVPMAVPESLH